MVLLLIKAGEFFTDFLDRILETAHASFCMHFVYYNLILHYADPAALTVILWYVNFELDLIDSAYGARSTGVWGYVYSFENADLCTETLISQSTVLVGVRVHSITPWL